MNQKPPKHLGISARVRWLLERDPTTLRDAENYRAKWGDYPPNFRGKRVNPTDNQFPKNAP